MKLGARVWLGDAAVTGALTAVPLPQPLLSSSLCCLCSSALR